MPGYPDIDSRTRNGGGSGMGSAAVLKKPDLRVAMFLGLECGLELTGEFRDRVGGLVDDRAHSEELVRDTLIQ